MNQIVTNLPQWQELQKYLPQLQGLYERYERSSSEITRLAEEAQCFTVRVPLVGAFSCGKTSVINALIGEKLFAVEVNPETALPVELTYSQSARFLGHDSSGQVMELSKEQVQSQQFSSLLPDGWLEARLPASSLQAIQRLTLVDMPGWDSGIDQHSKAIDNYLHRSLAYCLVVSADEGSVRESLRAFIKELAVRNMPALVVITKADKKPQDEVDRVEAAVTKEITDILGESPIGVVQVSARKKQVQNFAELLGKLQDRSGERFSAVILDPFLRDLAGLEKRLKTLINQENLSEAQLQAEWKDLELEMQQFEQKVRQETDALDAQLVPAANQILRRVESSLLGQVESLAAQAVNGGDIKGSIGSTLRLAISEGIQEEFAPKLRHYFQRIEREIPESLSINTELNLSTSTEQKGSDFEFDMSSFTGLITSILPFILAKVTGPIGMLIGGVVSLLSGFLGGSRSTEDSRASKEEAAKSKIISSVIPQVKTQVESKLREHLNEQVEVAKARILEATEEQRQQHEQTLNQLQEELKQGREAFEKKRQQYQSDLQALQSIHSELSEKRMA